MGIGFRTRVQPAAAVALTVAGFLAMTGALADAPAVLGDLNALNAEKLTREQLEQQLPGAKMTRKNASSGSTHNWRNDPDGTFIVSTDNRSGAGGMSITGGSATTAPGKWHVSPDGRYCVTIEWKRVATEDWCRYVFKTSDGYYMSKSDNNRAEKVYRLWINGE